MIAAILIGRKGSKAFPGKNTHPVLNRPLAYYPMRAAKECPQIDEIYLSTDDSQLTALGKENGIEIIERPPHLCSDKALGEDAYLHAYNVIKTKEPGRNLELLVLLMCNAPTITSKTISEGIEILRKHPEYDSCVTVSRYNMWSPLRARKVDSRGLLKPFIPFELLGDQKALSCDRDSQGEVWFADMGVSIIRPKCLEQMERGLLPQRWMGRNIYSLKQWGGCDVDYEWQIPQVEYWLKNNLKTADINERE